MAVFADFLKLQTPVHPSSCALFAAKAAKESREAATLPGFKTLVRVCFPSRACWRCWAERNSSIGEDVAGLFWLLLGCAGVWRRCLRWIRGEWCVEWREHLHLAVCSWRAGKPTRRLWLV